VGAKMNCNCSSWCGSTFRTSIIVSGNSALASVPSKVCRIKASGCVGMSVTANTATTESVFLSFCDGTIMPLYLATTGEQAIGSSFVAGVCYELLYDAFSEKVFVVGSAG
jgi:hypothetical protein